MAARGNDLPEFQTRRPTSDLEHVYNELKQSFMIGEFAPGQRLPLPDLAAAFGTSQMPIREAANRLVVARAIEALPRRSLRVPEATTERLDALLPLRLQLEGEATRLAVLSGNQSMTAELTAINDAMYAKVPSEDIKSYLRLNQQFHFTIYQNCGNSHLVDLIELLWMRYGPLMNVVLSGVLSRTGHIRHAEVIEAIKEGDPEKASAAVRADILEAAGPIRDAIVSAKAGGVAAPEAG
ncbi:GntR family transcriptional regulator [Azospirillum canadense]|uniref:GntR family transcriptional regulator n=1 Tax=Azospirillum canadense TaxID=403962 RepID=UPI002226AA8A|nr:GntR family transcriptional regulator [Azospirillum canadense]MCW2239413.1 DNA-binding GntR family transcriptional regulator [Azospirillum canadense]